MRDLDESLVQAVGWAVIEAGRAEGTAGELLMLFRPTGVAAAARDWHSSGSTLATALLRAAAERNNLQLSALADRMEHATKQRNDVVHGEWINASGVALVTFRRSFPRRHLRVATPADNGRLRVCSVSRRNTARSRKASAISSRSSWV